MYGDMKNKTILVTGAGAGKRNYGVNAKELS